MTTPDAYQQVWVPISPGELIDKITILEIKADRIGNDEKRANVQRERSALHDVFTGSITASDTLTGITAELKRVNEVLWQVEDEIRDCERAGDFGPRFITLARSVYRQNDQRAALKRRINELLGSALIEEKSYAPYSDKR